MKVKEMLSDCCESYPAPKAYACKAQPPASAITGYTTSANYTPITTIAAGTTISFDTLAYAKQMLSQAQCPMTYTGMEGLMPKNKKDEQMFNSTSDLEIQQRNFLKTRAGELESTKRAEARKAFNIDYTFRPKTKDELLEALKTATIDDSQYGYFTKDGASRYDYDARTLLATLKLTDGTKIDREGYDAAKAKLSDALRDLKDTITVAPLTDAVAAFEAFKKATFH